MRAYSVRTAPVADILGRHSVMIFIMRPYLAASMTNSHGMGS
jgi:hypothetical protein